MKHIKRWPVIVVSILLTHLILMIVAVILFVRYNDDQVIPNYYEKAVRWDETKAARERENLSQPGAAGAAATQPAAGSTP